MTQPNLDRFGIEIRCIISPGKSNGPQTIHCPRNAHPLAPSARPGRRADFGCLRRLQRLTAHAASRRRRHDLLAVHGRADRRYSRAAGKVPADAFHRLRACRAVVSGAVHLRGLVPGQLSGAAYPTASRYPEGCAVGRCPRHLVVAGGDRLLGCLGDVACAADHAGMQP